MTDLRSDERNSASDLLAAYCPIRRLGIAVSVALSIYLVAVLVGTIADWIDWRLTSRIAAGQPVSEAEIARIDRWIELSDRAFLVVYAGTALVFLTTIYRLASNARVLRRNAISTPAAAIVWFFVPALCLFMPYLTMQRIWQASDAGDRPWRENPPSVLVRRWWGLWIMSNVAGWMTTYMKNSAQHSTHYQAALVAGFVASVVYLGLGFAAMLLIRRLARRQHERYSVLRERAARRCSACGEKLETATAECLACGAELGPTVQPV